MKNLYIASFIIALVGCESVPEAVPPERGAAKKDMSSKTVSRVDLYVKPELEQKNSKIWGIPSKSSCAVPSGAKDKSWEAKKDTMAYYAESKKFPILKE
ncbi:MAG: hypothetical protein K2X53_05145 [Alphaproteobacteria bacterium]|nr:hypothetical protein [Alphaproteobacteria bacterium]